VEERQRGKNVSGEFKMGVFENLASPYARKLRSAHTRNPKRDALRIGRYLQPA